MGMFGSGGAEHHNSVRHVATYKIPLISVHSPNMPLKRTRNIAFGIPVDVISYIQKKPNQNLLICGTTGQGKSKLMRLMLEMMPNPKVVFSYKENDEYLQIEGNFIAAEKSLPNPFQNPEAFTDAFAVTFNIQSEGIQASTAISLVNTLARESISWHEFVDNAKKHAAKAKDINIRSATTYLLEKIKSLTYNSQQIDLDLDNTNILDMSYLNDDAKTFYSELFLRQIYKKIKQRSKDSDKVIVCVDEAHRLSRNVESKRQSIINEMSREIRAFGMLWTATQNLSDIPDQLRNQFATQFAFSTTSENDLRAMSQIDRDLALCTSELRNHEFVDAKHEKVHATIAIFKANIGSLKERDLEELRPAEAGQHEPVALKEQAERPTATHQAAMLAIYSNPSASKKQLADYLKKKGWITSETTIYGNKSRLGIFDSLVSLGLARKLGSGYELSGKAIAQLGERELVEKAKNSGSELHRQLIRKTIKRLHDDNTYIKIPDDPDAPDLIAYPMAKGSKKYLWDDSKARAYEIQTTADKENVLANRKRNLGLGLPTTWVCYEESLLEEIRKLTNNEDEYLLIRLDK